MKKSNNFFLPMVVDVNKFKFKPMRKRSNIFTFLFIGRFVSLKQIEIIMEFLLNFENNNNVQLILIGDGPLYPKFLKKYSLHSNIIFKGGLHGEKLKKEYELGHILIMASNNENWGLVINESYVCLYSSIIK